MIIHDITVSISNRLFVWPGDRPVSLGRISKLEEGAESNVSALSLSVHTGTHVDAPAHFIAGGGTVEGLPLEVLVGPAALVEIPAEVRLITAEVLEQVDLPAGTERVLFKTWNSTFWPELEDHFRTDYVGLDESTARWLVARGVKLVGIDYLSVSSYAHTTSTHLALLQAGVVLLEGLDLSKVRAGEYELFCLPLKLLGSDGAPARVVLIER